MIFRHWGGRRAAICPYDQFPTLQQLAVYDKSKLKLIDEPNAAILKQNMFVAMDKKSAGISTAFGGNMGLNTNCTL